MKQKQFEAEYAPLWSRVEGVLRSSGADRTELPELYRRLCQSLALSLQRGYSPALSDYLQRLVLEGHQLLYGTPIERPLQLRTLLLHTLPQRVREEWRLLLLAIMALFGIGLAIGIAVWMQPQLASSFIDRFELARMQEMYSGNSVKDGRGGDDGDFLMFGFYIWNNISIAFRTFAGGVFGGIPALLSLAFNGMHMGVIGSWLSADMGTRHNFWSFVIAHASVELTGLLLSGVAGIRLGLSLILPGRLSRRHALYASAQRVFPILVGATLLTLLAAFIEAFWSASPGVSYTTKYMVGAACWLVVIVFFVFGGRSR